MGQIFPGGDVGVIKDGMKEQALGTSRKVYELINLDGGGRFVDYLKVRPWWRHQMETFSA